MSRQDQELKACEIKAIASPDGKTLLMLIAADSFDFVHAAADSILENDRPQLFILVKPRRQH